MSMSVREHFHVMAKPTGAVCNLDCEYCFFLSKEQLYPDSEFRMTAAVHEAYLEQLFAAHPADAEVIVSYQGGEPTLMGLEFFERSVELAGGSPARPAASCTRSRPTATLLDDEWCAFLAEQRVPGRAVDRRPARDARRLPCRQGRQADLRPGPGRAGRCCAGTAWSGTP